MIRILLILLLIPLLSSAHDITALFYSADNELFVVDGSLIRAYSSKLDQLNTIRGSFNRPLSIAVNKNNKVFVVDTGHNIIKKLQKDSTLISPSFGTNENFSRPSGIAIDSKGNIFVSDTGNDCIKKFDNDGKLILKIGKRGYGDSEFLNPYHITIDKEDNVYVIDVGNLALKKFNNSGNFILKIHGDLKSISDVAININKDIYITDFESRCVKIYDKEGKFIKTFKDREEFVQPTSIAISNEGNIAVYDNGNEILKIFNQSGQQLTQLYGNLSSNNWFGWLYDIAINKNGEIYSTFFRRDFFVKFDNDGNFSDKYGSNGSADGLFRHPRGIAIDSMDKIYIADLFNNRIQSFSPEGRFISSITNVEWPMYITLDKNDNLYVSNTGTGTIKKFSKDGKLMENIYIDEHFNPGDIVIDKDDNIYAINTLNGFLIVYNQKRKTKEYHDLALKIPHSIAIDDNNIVYIFDAKDTVIKKFKDFKLDLNIKVKLGRREPYVAIYVYNNTLYSFSGTILEKF